MRELGPYIHPLRDYIRYLIPSFPTENQPAMARGQHVADQAMYRASCTQSMDKGLGLRVQGLGFRVSTSWCPTSPPLSVPFLGWGAQSSVPALHSRLQQTGAAPGVCGFGSLGCRVLGLELDKPTLRPFRPKAYDLSSTSRSCLGFRV